MNANLLAGVGAALAWVLLLMMAFAFCRAAGRADDQAERDYQNLVNRNAKPKSKCPTDHTQTH